MVIYFLQMRGSLWVEKIIPSVSKKRIEDEIGRAGNRNALEAGVF